VPFLRNTYTVFAYDEPFSNGTFPPSQGIIASASTTPYLGVLGLTDPTTALAEFQTVRVQRQPLPSFNGTSTASGSESAPGSGKTLAVGLKVLLGVGCFFALAVVLFAARWFVMRRKLRREGGEGDVPTAFSGMHRRYGFVPSYQVEYLYTDDLCDRNMSKDEKDNEAFILYRLGQSINASGSKLSRNMPSEEDLRRERYHKYVERTRSSYSDATYDSDSTRIGPGSPGEQEFGWKAYRDKDDGDDTLVKREPEWTLKNFMPADAGAADEINYEPETPTPSPRTGGESGPYISAGVTAHSAGPRRPESVLIDDEPSPTPQQADYFSLSPNPRAGRAHSPYAPMSPSPLGRGETSGGVAVPLLAHTRNDSRDSEGSAGLGSPRGKMPQLSVPR
jgi:hypothetical protein